MMVAPDRAESRREVVLKLGRDDAKLVASTLRARAAVFRDAVGRSKLALSAERAPDDLIEAWRKNGEMLDRVADQLEP